MRISRDDRMWMACLDDETDARESRAYAGKLSPDRRDLLAREATLDAKIAERLAEGGECPDDVWGRTQRLARRRSDPSLGVRPTSWWPAARMLAAAAILLAVLVPFAVRLTPSADPLSAAETTSALAREAHVSGSIPDARAFVADNGYEFALSALPSSGKVNGHRIELLGAGLVEHEAGNGVSLLYSCCGWPVRVVVARRGSGLAGALADANRDGRISGYRVFGDYVAAAIGKHDGSKVLGLLE